MPVFLLFVSSYAPLSAMLAIRFTSCGLRLFFASSAALGFLIVLRLLTADRDEPDETDDLLVTGDAGADVGGYLAAYLLPFLTVGKPDLATLFAYGIFLLVAGVIWCRSGLIHINPTLYLFRRRVLSARQEVEGGKYKEVFVITGLDGSPVGTHLGGRQIADRVWLSSPGAR